MKSPSSFLTNTTTPTGRTQGAAINNPGDNSGTGMDKEIYNDPAYGIIAMITSYKEDGISDADETTVASDLRDALEEMTERTVDSISAWDETTIYTSVTLVSRKGYQFVAYNLTGNNAKDPITNPDYWFKIPRSDILLDMFFSGEPQSGGLSSINDRSATNYKQNSLFGKYRLGGTGDDYYNFYRVALDGTQVTSNATLEAIFDPGGSNEYWNIDIIAPEVLSTRTLIDIGDYVPVPQSSSGDADTVGVLVDDQFQGHKHTIEYESVLRQSGGSNTQPIKVGGGLFQNTSAPITDGGFGTPRTGSTTHGKRFTVGASYVVVMVAA